MWFVRHVQSGMCANLWISSPENYLYTRQGSVSCAFIKASPHPHMPGRTDTDHHMHPQRFLSQTEHPFDKAQLPYSALCTG